MIYCHYTLPIDEGDYEMCEDEAVKSMLVQGFVVHVCEEHSRMSDQVGFETLQLACVCD